ncbi:MAG: AMP-binding protein [Gammaproteobacteria bacterium]
MLRPDSAPGRSYEQGRLEPPLRHRTIGAVFDETVAQQGSALALVSIHQRLRFTYSELAAEVDAVASGFLCLGISRGDRVGLWSPNCAEWIVVQLATARIGAILVTINPAYRVAELEHALNLTGCCALVLAGRFKSSDYTAMLLQLAPEALSSEMGQLGAQRIPALRWIITLAGSTEVPPQLLRYDALAARGRRSGLEPRIAGLEPDDAINIQFTSGTTGLPKGATLTHRSILNNGITVGRGMEFRSRDRLCLPVPLYHCFGMVMGVLNCVAHGAAIVLPSDSFDARAVLRAVASERCTALFGVPTMFIAALEALASTREDLSSLRTGIMAGAPCPVEVMKRVIGEMHMPEVVICYGMTETSPVSFQTGLDATLEQRVATAGRILPHLEAQVVSPSGQILPRGEPGELLVRGYSVMKGYWNDAKRTAEAVDAEGWMHTGDLATLDVDGYCRIVGRCKDMIIRGGENVYPAEIEQYLYGHPAVAQVAVFGIPDSKFGEIVCAWIVPKTGESVCAEDIAEFCRARIAHYKVPAHIRIVTEMPATVTGKLQKFLMQESMRRELGLVDT